MHIITPEDLIKFVLAQPDERAVNLCNGSGRMETRCVLCHYAESKGWGYSFVDFVAIYETDGSTVAEFSKAIDFDRIIFNKPIDYFESIYDTTYGELKKRLKK
jgi:hypothetical protein